MKKISILIMFSLLVSCDIMKQKSSHKSDTDFTENIKTKTYRPGDTVDFKIPRLKYVDTTITVVNKNGTTQHVIYDKEGNIDLQCISSKFEEMREENRRFQQELLDKQKEKTEKFIDTWILYIIIGIAVIVCFGMFLLSRSISKQGQALTGIVELLAELKNKS